MLFETFQFGLQSTLFGLSELVDFGRHHRDALVEFVNLGFLQDGDLPEALGVGFFVEVDVRHNDHS